MICCLENLLIRWTDQLMSPCPDYRLSVFPEIDLF